jgi:uncharacterized DUF497 family protein
VEFEWDEAKRQSNLRKHQFDFTRIARLLAGPHVFAAGNAHPFEVRWLVTGLLEARIVTAVVTLRGERIRIISLRSARSVEKRRYQATYG